MEISPIPGIRLTPISKILPAVLGPQPVFDMENYSHISDESYTPDQEASDSGGEDAFYDSDEPNEQQESASPLVATEEGSGPHFNLIA